MIRAWTGKNNSTFNICENITKQLVLVGHRNGITFTWTQSMTHVGIVNIKVESRCAFDSLSLDFSMIV